MVEILFFVFATVAVGSAFGVVLARSPVGSLLSMVSTLGSVAGIYILLEAHFLAAIQVIVYAGAIMVLFLFVIMLLNLGHDYQRDVKGWVASMIVLAVTGALGGIMAYRIAGAGGAGELDFLANATALDADLVEKGAVGIIAEPLFTRFVVPFEITGILLLVAIVGALALAKRREG